MEIVNKMLQALLQARARVRLLLLVVVRVQEMRLLLLLLLLMPDLMEIQGAKPPVKRGHGPRETEGNPSERRQQLLLLLLLLGQSGA